MLDDLFKLEKLINSELTSKIQSSFIDNNELLVEINDKDFIEVIQFLKSNDKCKFRQLIDIAGVDYPQEENAHFFINLSFLSHEKNNRIKLSIKFRYKTIETITKIFPSANWMEREVLICMESSLKTILI